MSNGLSILSDDASLSQNGTAKPQTNGHVAYANGNGALDEDSPMSEDDSDDDVPLLSQSSRVKAESETPKRLLKRKAVTYSSSSDDDMPLASSQIRSAAVPMPGAVAATTVSTDVVEDKSKIKRATKSRDTLPAPGSSSDDDDDDDDDAPLGTKLTPNGKANGRTKVPPKKKVKKEEDEDAAFSSGSDDLPKKRKTKKASSKANGVANGKGKNKAKVKSEEVSDDNKPATPKKRAKRTTGSDGDVKLKPKKRATKAKKEEDEGEASSSQAKKRQSKEDDEEEGEEVFRWWEAEDPNGDGSIKWTMLEHNGVYFPPPYQPLPPDVKMKYNGKPVDLPPESEEVAGFYGAMLETDHAQDAVFNKNFFKDFLKVLEEHPPRDGTKIKEFERCDFRPVFEYYEAEKAKKKAMTSAEKKALKAEKDKLEAPYTSCVLDGRKEKVGNFRIEPPGLFRGRGEHPKKGSLKLRVRPEDITINIGEGVPIPQPNMPGKWKSVIHDQTVTWLANWTENVNGNHKYVFLAAGSSLKGQSDMQKFEKARELKNHVDRIRQDYNAELRSKLMADRQRATAMYFIDRLALRAGNEKGEDEADTVGCCSLRCEHVTLEPPNFVIFDFLGKDSIRFYKRVEIEPQIFKNIRIFKENKEDADALFDRVTTTLLNKHLQSYMKGLTAKVFRTYNASITFQEQLEVYTPKEGSVQEKLNAYNKANRMVAILCNHQRSVPKTHSASMEKMSDKLKAIKYERRKMRHVLFELDPKYKKKKEYKGDESDLDDEWIARYEDSQKEKEIEKANKKFAKDNEKAEAEGEKPRPESELKERIKDIEDEFKRLKKERGTGKATLKRARPPEKIEEAIEKLNERIKTHKLQMVDREEGKEVSLGTSKINYLDPRITSAWCKDHGVPIEKIFSKALLNKFPWAMEVESDWKF
ncbi:TOP1 [Sanghuangporus sanghuang]